MARKDVWHMLATYSDLRVSNNDFDEYVKMRRVYINPALAEQPGFQGSVLLKATEQGHPGEVTLGLFQLLG